MNPPVVVVAAVIERLGRVLICRRRPSARHPMLWEFPGGKVEPGEDPRTALRRELLEELGVHAEIGEEIRRYPYQYPHGAPLLLIFFRATVSGAVQNRVFAEIRWEMPERLADYDFLPGDREFVGLLASLRSVPPASYEERG